MLHIKFSITLNHDSFKKKKKTWTYFLRTIFWEKKLKTAIALTEKKVKKKPSKFTELLSNYVQFNDNSVNDEQGH